MSSTTATPIYPPLEWDRILSASQKNLPDEIRRLVDEEGVDPKHANRVGQSALHIAALWGHVEAVKVLIELGANVNAANNISGGTPLHCVAQSSRAPSANRHQVVDLLIQAGANPSTVDFHGHTAVEYCSCDEFDDEALRARLQPQVPPIFLLLQQQQKPTSYDDANQLRQLLKDDPSSVNVRHRGMTPLLVLIEDLLQQLENTTDAASAKKSDKNQQQQPPRDAASWIEILQILLEHKADPNALPIVPDATATTTNPQDSEDATMHKMCLALKDAHRVKDTERIQLLEQVIQLLLQLGATVPTPTKLLLHDAARRNQLELVQFLLNVVKVDVNTKGRQGMTALQFAARSGQVDMVQYLLSSRSDVNVTAQDDRGKTALDAARANDHSNIVTLLESYTNNIGRVDSQQAESS